MAIEPGQDWGAPGQLGARSPVIHDDQALNRLLAADLSAPDPNERLVVGIAGGDLCRTLGGRGDTGRMRSPEAQRLPCDVGLAAFAGHVYPFAAHCVVRGSWLRGPVVAVMNGAWMGEWNLAPRAHPGDGRLDVVETQMALSQRIKARSRLGHGGHLPHPDISVRKVKRHRIELPSPTKVWIDGTMKGTATSIDITVLESHFDAVV